MYGRNAVKHWVLEHSRIRRKTCEESASPEPNPQIRKTPASDRTRRTPGGGDATVPSPTAIVSIPQSNARKVTRRNYVQHRSQDVPEKKNTARSSINSCALQFRHLATGSQQPCAVSENKQPSAFDFDRDDVLPEIASLTLAGVERKAAVGSTDEQLLARRDQHGTHPIAALTCRNVTLQRRKIAAAGHEDATTSPRKLSTAATTVGRNDATTSLVERNKVPEH